VEIRINSQPCKGINLTTWHTRARRAPWVATFHDVIKESGWVLPHPSDVFHVYALADTPWVARTLSCCTPMKRGKVSSNSVTHEATEFTGPQKILYAPVHNRSLFIRTQPMWALIDTSGGYHHGSPNLWSRSLSSFPSSILHFPLIAPPSLKFCQHLHKFT
jgi:hypothetical protein